MARPKGKRRGSKTVGGQVIAGFISPGQVHAEFAVGLATNAQIEKKLQGFIAASGARMQRARNDLIREFIQAPPEFEWLWLVDADMVLPGDALQQLLLTAKRKNRKVVGGLGYIFKPGDNPPFLASIVLRATPEYMEELDVEAQAMGDQFIINAPPRERYIEASGTGFFCLLIHRSVLETMGEHFSKIYNNPWIDELEQGAGKPPKGPDMEFFDRMKLVTGEVPLIDTSVRCGHIKQFTITHETALKSYHGEMWEQFQGFVEDE